jgi:hypothetical protein
METWSFGYHLSQGRHCPSLIGPIQRSANRQLCLGNHLSFFMFTIRSVSPIFAECIRASTCFPHTDGRHICQRKIIINYHFFLHLITFNYNIDAMIDRSWMGVGIEEFMGILDRYLIWHNEKGIKLSLGGMSPLEYRLKCGLVV